MSEIVQRKEEVEYTIDLITLFNDLWKGIKKFSWLVIVLTILSALFSCLYTYRSYYPRYIASATFTVSINSRYGGSMYEESVRADQMSRTFPYIINSGLLRNMIEDDLGIDVVSEAITADNVESTNIFTIKVSSGNPQRAYHILQSVIRNYPRVAEAVVGSTKLKMLDESGIPSEPSEQINYRHSLKIGVLPGAAAGMLIIVIYAMTRNTIHKVEDIEKLCNIRYLGSLPEVTFKKRGKKSNKTISLMNEKLPTTYRDNINRIRARIDKAAGEKELKSIIVTSAIPGEGKSTFAFNLALSLAHTGKKVILLDCDLRRPTIRNIVEASSEAAGLAEVLDNKCNLEIALQYHEDLKLYTLTSTGAIGGSPELIGSYKMSEILKELEKIADYIIIDTAPVAILSDTSELAKIVDGVVYLIKQDYANAYHILIGLDHLSESSDIEMLGCVINGVRTGLLSYGYAYGYGHYGRYGT